MNFMIDSIQSIDWRTVQALISAVGIFIAAIAALIAVIRVDKIVAALKEFQRSREMLHPLLDALDRLETMPRKLKQAASDIQDDVSDLKRVQASPEAVTTAGLPITP